jgi:ABC-type transport system involved in multi-copper enzyme maturation permease subunit
MNTILTIAQLTIAEARRRRVLLAGLVFGLGFLALFGFGYFLINREIQLAPSERSVLPPSFGSEMLTRDPQLRVFFELMTTAGLYAANFLTIMMAVLTPVDTLSGEVQSGAIQSILVKPARREQIVLGKWLGFWLMLAGYVLLTAGGVALIAWLVNGFGVRNIATGLGLMLLEATVLLSVSIAGGARLSTLANGVMGFGLFGLAFMGGWVEQIGALVQNQTAQNIGVISSLLIPSDALWRLAAYTMQSPIVREVAVATPLGSTTLPSNAMIAWALIYIAGVLGLGMRVFGRRDL